MDSLKVMEQRAVLGKNFKIYGDKDNPLFLAKDVKEWIEHNNITLMLNSVDNDEKLTYVIHNSGQNREMWFLTEDGLYEVLMQSRKPIAKAFKKQVKAILKEIRKTGSYKRLESYMIDDPIERARVWIEEYEEKQILTKNLLVQKEIIQEYKPKAEVYDSWIESNNLSTATVLAKAFGFKSTVQFNRELELRGIQYKKGGCWHLRAEYSGLGYTAYRSHEIQHTREMKSHDIMYWTNSGKEFIKNILSKTVIPVIKYDQVQF